jgi:hypothetical protein
LEEEHRRLHRRLSRVITDLLEAGVERGDVRRDLDVELMLEIISSVYLTNFRTALYSGFDADDLNARMSRQLDLLFEGAGPR